MKLSNRKTPYLIDSSVLVKWFVEEQDSNSAIRIRNDSVAGKIDIATAELAYYELANALRNSRVLSESDVHRAVEAVRAERILVMPFDLGGLHVAIENAFEYGLSLYDAYFVALADLEGMRLVTADKQLAAKVQGRGDVVTLSDYSAQ
ncbi:MAG: type II toxin-antitoxin system VapC family toxin [Actinomycetota bacterium]